jgi:iron(III) transport system substrate-binding protein
MGKLLKTALAVAALGCLAQGRFVQGAAAQGQLNLYCSATIEWCQALGLGFEQASGIRVVVAQKSTGEMLAQIRAEARNPRGDVWWGGTGDPHISAAEEGLSVPYQSQRLDELYPWAKSQHTQTKGMAVGVYAGILGFGFNTELLARRKLKMPVCWADLLKPEFKGEVQMANPNSSGTAYVVIATLVQLMGEEGAFDYLKKLHQNINQYSRSGTGPIMAVARGETSVSISFVHNAAEERAAGFPVGWVVPCEGSGYEIGSMSLIKGGRNPEAAKRFYDWALTADAQSNASRTTKKLQTMANRQVLPVEGAPSMTNSRLIDYDNARFGASVERRRLLQRWDREIGSLAH